MSENKKLSDRKYIIIGLIVVAILVGGVGRWFATAELAGAIISSGSIKVKNNRQIIQHPYGGVVEDIYVAEGDQVTEGKVLMRFEASELTTEMQIVSSQLAEVLARTARLQAERDGANAVAFPAMLGDLRTDNTDVDELIEGQQRLFESRATNMAARKTQVQKRIEQIINQIEGLTAQRTSVSEQFDLIGQELQNQEKLLAQGLAQATRVLGLQREKARLGGVRGQLQADTARAEGQITELELEILNLDSRLREEAITSLRDLQIRLLELSERRNQIKQRLDRLDVRAPLDGTVYDLNVFARKAVIRAADPLMYLIPQGQVLTVEVKVLPADIEQIFIGQKVDMKFSSFSRRTTPDLFGTVTTISADTFIDERSGVQFYLLEIAIQEGEIEKLPEGAVLIPGMPVDVFIETQSRTPLEYLLQPFQDYIDRAFRES